MWLGIDFILMFQKFVFFITGVGTHIFPYGLLFLNPYLPKYLLFFKSSEEDLSTEKIIFGVSIVLRLLIGGTVSFIVYGLFLQEHTTAVFVYDILVWIAIVNLIGTGIMFILDEDFGSFKVFEFIVKGVLFAIFLIALPIFNWVHDKNVFHDLAKIPEVVEINKPISEIEEKDFPFDPKTLPLLKKQTSLIKIGKKSDDLDNSSYYDETTANLSNVNGELTYTSISEFATDSKARKMGYTPGAYTVVATDRDAKPIFHKQKIVYTESNIFKKNLKRHLREKYPKKVILDAQYELDDKNVAKAVSSYGHYAKFDEGLIIEGVLITDIKTGKTTAYKKGKEPKWVDQVYPMSIADEYFTYWGEHRFGRQAYKLKEKTSVHEKLYETFNKKKELVYITYFTKPNKSKGGMSELGVFNAKTGVMEIYKQTDDMVVGTDALTTIENSQRFTANNVGGYLSPGYPTPHVLNGVLSYIVPVYDQKGNFAAITVISADGDPETVAYGKTEEDAFENYKQVLAGLGKGDALPDASKKSKKLEGKIERIGQLNGNMFIIKIEGQSRLFSIKTIEELAVTNPGDTISIQYNETEAGTFPITEFKNVTVPMDVPQEK